MNDDDVDEDRISDEERQWEQFMDLLKGGEVGEAYNVFLETPGLVNFIIPCRFGYVYDDIRLKLGIEKAKYFAIKYASEVHNRMEGVSLTDMLEEQSEIPLKNLLEKLPSAYEYSLMHLEQSENPNTQEQ